MVFLFIPALLQAQSWQLSVPAPADRGEPGPDHPASLPPGSVFTVDLDVQALSRATTASFPLPDGSLLELELAQASLLSSGSDQLLHGHARPGTQSGHAMLTLGEEGVFGRIGSAAGTFWLYTDRHGSWLIRLDDERIDLGHECQGPLGQTNQPLPSQAMGGHGTSAAEQIDVMMVYTPAMVERYPGTLLATRLNHFIAIANQAMVDSEVNAVVRLVHAELAAYDESDSIFDALYALRSGLEGNGSGVFADLDSKRDQYGADLVVMIWPHDIETRGACGVAFLPLWDDDAQQYDRNVGVHVTNDGISNWSVCDDGVFTHELGHNLGANHQRSTGAPDGVNYAHVAEGRYHTIMGSFGSSDISRYLRMPVFSNPDIQCGGDPCGSMVAGEEANNAQTLNAFAPIVSSYSSQTVAGTVTPPAPSFPDSDGDGMNDWQDPYPFDPYNGNPPLPPQPPEFVAPPMFDGSEISHFELLVASSGSDQVHAYGMDGSHNGLAVQAEPPAFPDQRPALSEFTDFDVRADSLVYMLSAADVRRFDRITSAELDIFLDSQPPWQPSNYLHTGFPTALSFSPDQQFLMVLGTTMAGRYDMNGFQAGNFYLPSLDDPTLVEFEPALRDLAFDTDGHVYIAAANNRRVVKYELSGLAYQSEVIAPNGTQMTDPWALAFGPDGGLYVANGDNNNVLRIDTDSGDIETFIAAGSGGLDFARDLVFGPDGHLYVLSRDSQAVLRFDAVNGQFIDAFLPPGSPGLNQPQSMKFALRMDVQIFKDRFEE